MISYFYLRWSWPANYMHRYLEIFYWEIPRFYLKMTICFFIFLSHCVVKYISIGHYRSFPSAFAILLTLVTQIFIEIWANRKQISDSTLGQSKSTKTINIWIMRIFYYKWVSKSVNSIMPCDEQFLLWGKINPHRN